MENEETVLTPIEAFEMVCDDPEKVEMYKTFYNLKKRITDNNGITQEDFDFLCSNIGFDDDMKNAIETGFKAKGLMIKEYNEEKDRGAM